MGYKISAVRQPKILQARYKVTSEPDYDAALIRWGNLTVRVTEAAFAARHASAAGKRSGQPGYFDLVIPTGLTLRQALSTPRLR